MRGFVCIAQGCYINKDLIDNEKTYFDAQKDRYVIHDIYGNKYLIAIHMIQIQELLVI